ncbi:helix-turn-helix domain-containing protein [Paenibacillus sp. NPDC058177]|uniref:helix-turn-helix domain-containing protein n=1 Tax=Paenibacillus sp. NPDC058177 TaxID=3346369 RepID=UPI0036D7B6EF
MTTRYSNGLNQHGHCFYMPIRVTVLSHLSADENSITQSSYSILIMVQGGDGYIEINNERLHLTPGCVLSFPGSTTFKLPPQSGLHGVWIEYTGVMPDGLMKSPLDNDLIPQLRKCPSQITGLGGELHSAWTKPQADKPFAVQALFTDLIMKVNSTPIVTNVVESSSGWLPLVLQYIDEHYSEDLTRSQMAGLAGVSPEHFSRSFRNTTGQTFSAYLSLLRIRKAQERLLTGTPNLSHLALEVGYGEGTYLSRKFKQFVGLSPTAYHSKNKRIVTLNYNHTASLRALEITPQLGPYSAWLESLDTVPTARKLSLEARRASAVFHSVASARPDVIISYSLYGENKQLLALAPVIELPFMQMSWREQFTLIAEVAGRRLQAEEWLHRYDQRCHEANLQLDRNMGARGTAIVWEIGHGCAYCFSSSYGRGCQVLYNDLGFKLPQAIIDQDISNRGFIKAAIEDIPDYPADHIIITGLPDDPQGLQRIDRLFHSEQWRQLEAVRTSRVHILDQPDMFYGFDPLSSQAQLHVLLRVLTS